MSDYDDIDNPAIDEQESNTDLENDADIDLNTDDNSINNIDLAEAETLTVTAKQKQRDALADEVAAFLARGGKITEIPPDQHQD